VVLHSKSGDIFDFFVRAQRNERVATLADFVLFNNFFLIPRPVQGGFTQQIEAYFCFFCLKLIIGAALGIKVVCRAYVYKRNNANFGWL